MAETVACAGAATPPPRSEYLRDLEVEQGTTIEQAIAQSGMLADIPGHRPGDAAGGLYGKKRPLDTVLRERDRIEIYRPLVADPKEARRRRAVKKASLNRRVPAQAHSAMRRSALAVRVAPRALIVIHDSCASAPFAADPIAGVELRLGDARAASQLLAVLLAAALQRPRLSAFACPASRFFRLALAVVGFAVGHRANAASLRAARRAAPQRRRARPRGYAARSRAALSGYSCAAPTGGGARSEILLARPLSSIHTYCAWAQAGNHQQCAAGEQLQSSHRDHLVHVNLSVA